MLPAQQNPTASGARVSPEVGSPTAQAPTLETPKSPSPSPKAESERVEKEIFEMIAGCGDVDCRDQCQMLPEEPSPTPSSSAGLLVRVPISPQFGAPLEDPSAEFSEEELREILGQSEFVDWRNHACHDPDHLHRKLQAQLRHNELERSGALSEQKPAKPVRTAREVAEEKYRKQQEREEEESRRGLREHPDSNVTSTAAGHLDDINYDDLVKEFNEIPGILTPYEEKVITHDAVFVDPATVHISTDPHWESSMTTEVFVESATSPASFFVNIHQQEAKMALKDLEDAMFKFYQAHWEVSQILQEEDLIMTGIYAVYSFDHNRWFRGKMIYVNRLERENSKIGAFLIDHGILVEGTCECFFPLRVSDTELPGQAALASFNVPNIKEMKWSDDDLTQFNLDVENKRFHAMVKRVGFHEKLHMPIVKIILLETVNGEERPYTFGGRLISDLNAEGVMDNA